MIPLDKDDSISDEEKQKIIEEIDKLDSSDFPLSKKEKLKEIFIKCNNVFKKLAE